jgi:hypothetical protein
LKTASGESLTGVRIPPSPPISRGEIAAPNPLWREQAGRKSGEEAFELRLGRPVKEIL